TDKKIDNKSFFQQSFSHDLNQIIHFDIKELDKKLLNEDLDEKGNSKKELLGAPWPIIKYDGPEGEHYKSIRITKRPQQKNQVTQRLRSVASTPNNSPNEYGGKDAKVPLPTIYLGMARMIPIGEVNESDVKNAEITPLEEADKKYFNEFMDSVIRSSNKEGPVSKQQSIQGTTKSNLQPTYDFDSKSISLGQDSLSSIATALTAFNKLKRVQGDDYVGGLLVIDEVDSGFHPHAQEKLIKALIEASNKLNVQIIATTHSYTLVEDFFKEIETQKRPSVQHKVIPLNNVKDPSSYPLTPQAILNQMRLTQSKTTIYAYFEDCEALYLFKEILEIKDNSYDFENISLKLIAVSLGCQNLINLSKNAIHFQENLIILDGDQNKKGENIICLPCSSEDANENPEKTIFNYLKAISESKKNDKYYNTREELQKKYDVSCDYIDERLLSQTHQNGKQINSDKPQRERDKAWFIARKEDLQRYEILKYWVRDHQQICDDFKNKLHETLNKLKRKT
ncbi:MAG: ATP-binding protein, partial [Neisseriaceae bacterium]|nr:ATP-binding protein [Neisseriaceae bacterium]